MLSWYVENDLASGTSVLIERAEHKKSIENLEVQGDRIEVRLFFCLLGFFGWILSTLW